MQRIHHYSGLAACALLTLLADSASAQTIVMTEAFDYADGALSAGNPAWINHSGTAGTLLVSAGKALVTQNSGSEDAHKLFDGGASFTTGIVSATFDIVVTAPGAMNNTAPQYFTHFWQSTATTAFRSRTYIAAPGAAGGDYTIGISTLNSTIEVNLGDSVGFNFGVVVPMTITFDIDAGTSSLTAGGFTVNTAVVSTGQNIDGFAFRQANSASDETIMVDNLIVTHVPEPSAFALVGGLIALGVLAVRRRR